MRTIVLIALSTFAVATAQGTINLPEPVTNEVSVFAIVAEPRTELFNALVGVYDGFYETVGGPVGPPSARFLPYLNREAVPPVGVPYDSQLTLANPYAPTFGGTGMVPGSTESSIYGRSPFAPATSYADPGYRRSYAPPPVSNYGPPPAIGSENLESWGYRPYGARGD
jgi:hypothetical protein